MAMSGNFNPPDRGKPNRLRGAGTRAKDDQKSTPPNPLNPDETKPGRP